MNLGITNCSYVQVPTGYGSALPLERSAFAASRWGATLRVCFEGLRRTPDQIARAGFGMSKNPTENRKNEIVPMSPARRIISRFLRDREARKQAVIDEMQEAIREIAGPYRSGELELARSRAAHRIGLTESEAYRLWYGTMRIIPAPIADAVRACRTAIRDGQPEEPVSEIHKRLERLERQLAGKESAT